MKNTPENKAKFFGQHWGQTTQYCFRDGVWEEEKLGSDYGISELIDSHEDAVLLLKAISQISDEDAIEVAKLMLSDGRVDSIKLMSDFVVNRIDEDEMYREPEMICITFNANLFADKIEKTRLTIYPNTKGITFYLGYFREIHESLPLHGIIRVIDYLRLKGYALPYNGVYIETLIEWGWVKLN